MKNVLAIVTLASAVSVLGSPVPVEGRADLSSASAPSMPVKDDKSNSL